MSFLERFANSLPGGGRVYYSGRWACRLAAIWRSPNRRFLAYPPGHFGSPLPDDAELRRDAQRLFAVPTELPGIDLRTSEQLELLRELAPFHAEWFFPTALTPGTRYFADNTFFPIADGLAIFAMLRRTPPKRVVEIGSGFSSAVMLDTADRFPPGPTQFTFIEPYPQRLLSLLTPADRSRTQILQQRVQDVPMDVFTQLQAGDLLFIDSSHVVKAGGDVNHLFFEVIPRLAPGVVVHVHDIFWPFEYPPEWFHKGYAWNEAYVLRGLLQHNRRLEMLFFPSYLEKCHSAAYGAALPMALQRSTHAPTIGAASIYLRVREES
ncbi:MAG: class I SAM-dependent methyltransferase [Gemmataceae bacterium]